MASPARTVLFSPPTPPGGSKRLPGSPQPNAATSSFRSYLLTERIPRSPDLERQGLRGRSPQSADISKFEPASTVPDYPSPYTHSSSSDKAAVRPRPGSSLAPPSQLPRRLSGAAAPRNVPSRPIAPDRLTIPRPIIRIILILAAFASCALFLARAPATHIPLLHTRSGSEYEPPHLQSARMLGRTRAHKATRTPKTFAPHPIPSSHELLALQSYLLQSLHNTLPAGLDPSKPLDGNVILAISPSKLGKSGSATELAWLKELEREREEDIIIWATGRPTEVAKMKEVLAQLHYVERSPTVIDVTDRPDGALLGKLLSRLGMQSEPPVVMLGNKAIYGGLEKLKAMYEDESLDVELKRIGWLDKWRAIDARAPPAPEDEDEDEEKKKGKRIEDGEVEAEEEVVGEEDEAVPPPPQLGKPRIMKAGHKKG